MKNTHRFLFWISALVLACFTSTIAIAQPPAPQIHTYGLAGTFTSNVGTSQNDWEIGGPSGPVLNNNGGTIEVRNAANSAYAIARAASPVGTNDLVTLGFLNSQGTSQPGATLVFQPGGTASANVFTTWSPLVTAAASINGPIKVFFDCSHNSNTCTVPAGAWSFTNPEVWMRAPLPSAASIGNATVAFADGATLTGNIIFSQINCTSLSNTTPVITITPASATTEYQVLDIARVWAGGTAPFFSVTGSVAAEFDVHDSFIGFTPSGSTAAHPTITSAGASSIITVILGGRTASAASGSITGAGADVAITTSSATNLSSAPTFLFTNASGLGYNDTLVSPALGSNNAQGAIDALKTRTTSAPGTTLVFQPGGTASTGVFTTWSSLMTAASSIVGRLTVQMDGTFSSNAVTIPAGTWAFTQPNVTFVGNTDNNATSPLNAVTVNIATGATLSGVFEYDGLNVVSASTSAVTTIASNTRIVVNRSIISSSTATAFFQVAAGTKLILFLNNSVAGDGTHPVMNAATSTSILDAFLVSNSTVKAAVFAGASGALFQCRLSDPNSTCLQQDGTVTIDYPGWSPTVLTYQPSGTVVTSTTFTSWSQLVAASNTIPTADSVYFDCTHASGTCTIPSGTWVFTNPRVDWIGSPQNTGSGAISSVVFANGSTLSGVDKMVDLTVTSNSSSPVITWTSTTPHILVLQNVGLSSTTSTAVISITGAGSNYIINALSSGNGGVFFGDGTHPVVNVGAGSLFGLNAGVATIAFPNSIGGTTTGATIYIDAPSVGVQTTGIKVINLTSFDKLIYDPGTPSTFGNVFSNWASLYAVASAKNSTGTRSSSIVIDFDCRDSAGVCTIPAGTYAFPNPGVEFNGRMQPGSTSGRQHVTLADGVSMSGVTRIVNLTLDTTATTAPPLSLTGQTLTVDASSLVSSSTQPLIAAGTTSNGITFTNFSVLGDGTHTAIDGGSTGSTQLIGDLSTFNASSTTGNLTVVGKTGLTNNTGLATNLSGTGATVLNFVPSIAPTRVTSNYFSNWGDLVAAANGVSLQPITVAFNGNATIPAGAWTFNNPKVVFKGTMSTPPGVSSVTTTITFADGATLAGNIEFQQADYVATSNTTPVITINAASTTKRYFLRDFGYLDANGTAPFVSVSGTVTADMVLEDAVLGAFSSGRAVVSSAGAASVVSLFLGGGGGASGLSAAEPGSVTGAGASVVIDATGAVNVSSAPTVLATQAKNLGYNDTLVPSPSIGTNVQAALDSLKGRVTNTLPSPGTNGNVLTVVGGAWTSAAPSGGAGITQLTNDVTAGPGSGSQSATVNGSSSTSPFYMAPSFIQWLTGTTTPVLTQADAAASTNGQTMSIQAQTAPSGNGGALHLLGGAAGIGHTAGTASIGSGGSESTFAASPTGFLLSGAQSGHFNWSAGVSGPTISQTTASGAATNMVIQAQSTTGASQNGGLLELLGGTGGSGGAAAGVLAGTGDGSAALSVQVAAVDLIGQNYRVGNFGGSYPTGTGGLALHDTSSLPTSAITSGTIVSSSSGSLVVTPSATTGAVLFNSNAGHPTFGQVSAPSGNGVDMTVAAQSPTSSGNGGNLLLRSGVGLSGGSDGKVVMMTGNGSNSVQLAPGSSSSFFGFGSGVTGPTFTQFRNSGAVNGQTLTLQAQAGGTGSGGTLLLWGSPQGCCTTGLQDGNIEILSGDQSQVFLLTDEQPSGTTGFIPAIIQENTLHVQSGINWVPAVGQTSSNHNSQLSVDEKIVTQCRITEPSQTFGECPVTLDMGVSGAVDIEYTVQCRIVTGGSSTVVGDTLTEHGFIDFVNTSNGSGAPTVSGNYPYGVVRNGSSHLTVYQWNLSGGTSAGRGQIQGQFQLQTLTGFLGSADCTLWTTEKFN